MKKRALDSLAQDSEVSSMLRSFDWTRCALGAPESWAPTLFALVSNILASKVPMMVNWGPDLLSIYNDAYRLQFLGNKHPAAFCQPYQAIWPEVWPYLEPVIERGWAGETTFFENALFNFERCGYQEQIWATFSHSPVFDAGVVVGALGVGIDVTAKVLTEKRQSFQLAFVDELRGLTNANDITVAATKRLGEHLGATRVFYAEIDDDAEGHFSVGGNKQCHPCRRLSCR